MMIKKNDKKINLVLNEALAGNKRLHKGITQRRVQEIWKEKMGPAIDQYTSKMYFNKGKLSITITSAPLRQELNYSKSKIISMLNAALQTQDIKEVSIK